MLLDPFGSPARGRSAIEANLSRLLRGPMQETRTRIEVKDARRPAPDVVFAGATQRLTGVQGAPGMPSELEFHVVAVQKEEDGPPSSSRQRLSRTT